MTAPNPNLDANQRAALAASIGQAVAGSLDSVFGGASAPAATPASVVPGIHLRYGTLKHFVPQTEFNGFTVRDLFDRNAANLSLGEGEVTYRESGGSVCGEDTYPVVGKEYIATVDRETKGW